MANAPHAVIEDCFDVQTNEPKMDYFNRTYFHRFTTYILFLNTVRKDYFTNMFDILTYGNSDSSGFFLSVSWCLRKNT